MPASIDSWTRVAPACSATSLRALAYNALIAEIIQLSIYEHPFEFRIDENKLLRKLNVSRTPIREAITILEYQGLVRRRPRHGVFVVKKNMREIIEMVYACVALESMAVRLACIKATDEHLGALRKNFNIFYEESPSGECNRYFEARWRFCRHVATLAQCAEILSMLDYLLLHLRSVHAAIFRQNIDFKYLSLAYGSIIAALELRDAECASQLILERGFRFARDIESGGDCFLFTNTEI